MQSREDKEYKKIVCREMRKHGTAAEAVLWRGLKNRQIKNTRWRRQYSVSGFILDFYCPELRIGIELDGAPHFSVIGRINDNIRTEIIENINSIKIIRFENRQVFEESNVVLMSIEQLIDERRNELGKENS